MVEGFVDLEGRWFGSWGMRLRCDYGVSGLCVVGVVLFRWRHRGSFSWRLIASSRPPSLVSAGFLGAHFAVTYATRLC